MQDDSVSRWRQARAASRGDLWAAAVWAAVTYGAGWLVLATISVRPPALLAGLHRAWGDWFYGIAAVAAIAVPFFAYRTVKSLWLAHEHRGDAHAFDTSWARRRSLGPFLLVALVAVGLFGLYVAATRGSGVADGTVQRWVEALMRLFSG